MRESVASDDRIDKAQVPLAEAVAIFQSRGEEDKVRLIAHREKPVLTMYRLRERQDCFQGYMVASAGCLRYFALHAFPPGFMLQFPHQSRATEVAPITPYPKLFTVFEEAGHWLDRLGIRGAGALNDAIVAGRLPEISLVAEALHAARIAQIAADLTSTRKRVVLVFVAGPSASGKTIFAKRLSVQFLANGRRPLAI
jgi:uridine kinase